MSNIAIYQEGFTDGFNEAKSKYERPQGEWLKAQGEWVTDTAFKICFECSKCHSHLEYPFDFCPICGAAMNHQEVQE